LSNREAAEEAARLEIGLVKEPIGKQDQYAAAFGGFNVFQFNPDESVDVTPVHLDYQKRHEFEKHLFVFFTGIRRLASSVLTEQSAQTHKNMETLQKMADSVFEFKEKLCAGDFQSLGRMLHEGWLRKKTLASNLSNGIIDEYYAAGIEHGAWGGKVLGAGGGGSMLFFAPPEAKPAIRIAVQAVAAKHNLSDFNEIPVTLVQSGVEIVMNNERTSKTTLA
jgi:D-glycero-alpha-D-manno-heptose-7-phosphate kinase